MEIWCYDGSLIVNTSGRFHSLNEGGLLSVVDEYTLIQWVFQAKRKRMRDWIAASKPQQFVINQLVNQKKCNW